MVSIMGFAIAYSIVNAEDGSVRVPLQRRIEAGDRMDKLGQLWSLDDPDMRGRSEMARSLVSTRRTTTTSYRYIWKYHISSLTPEPRLTRSLTAVAAAEISRYESGNQTTRDTFADTDKTASEKADIKSK